MRALVISLLVAIAASAAPVPIARSLKGVQVVPGNYLMTWGGDEYPCILYKNGSYSYQYDQIWCCGSWSWNPATRIFVITETHINFAPRIRGHCLTCQFIKDELRMERLDPEAPGIQGRVYIELKSIRSSDEKGSSP